MPQMLPLVLAFLMYVPLFSPIRAKAVLDNPIVEAVLGSVSYHEHYVAEKGLGALLVVIDS